MGYRPWRGRSAAYLARGEEPMDWAEMMRRFRGASSSVLIPMSDAEVQEAEQVAFVSLAWPRPSVAHQVRGSCTHVRPERQLRVAIEKVMGLADGFALAHLTIRADPQAVTALIYAAPQPLRRFIAQRSASGLPVFSILQPVEES